MLTNIAYISCLFRTSGASRRRATPPSGRASASSRPTRPPPASPWGGWPAPSRRQTAPPPRSTPTPAPGTGGAAAADTEHKLKEVSSYPSRAFFSFRMEIDHILSYRAKHDVSTEIMTLIIDNANQMSPCVNRVMSAVVIIVMESWKSAY